MTRKTALHPRHIALGARMGGFAGYDMPLFYADGVLKEHEWVRSRAGVFDVSHMGQVIVTGPGAAGFFEKLTPSAFAQKKPGRAQYTVLTNEGGGIIDDLIVTRLAEDKFFAVINAGCKDKDVAWMREHLPAGLTLDFLDDRGLVALQGPAAEKVLSSVAGVDLSGLGYMSLVQAKIFSGEEVFISRLGYTGEDGFEISIEAAYAPAFWDLLLDNPDVRPVGLAARDSLRLEMGYALYGHDIDATTTPVEAGLEWVMSRFNTGFIGAQAAHVNPPLRRRVGLKLLEKGVAREGAEIRSSVGGPAVGRLTSGGFSPTLRESIGMGYVETALSWEGTMLAVNVRGRDIPAQVVALPFMAAKTKAAGIKAA